MKIKLIRSSGINIIGTESNQIQSRIVADEIDDLPRIGVNPQVFQLSQSYEDIFGAISLRFPVTVSDSTYQFSDIATQVADAYMNLKKCDECKSLFGALHKTATEIGERVQNSFTVLQDIIKPDVDNLKELIDANTSKTVIARGEDVVLGKSESTLRTNYSVVNWLPSDNLWGDEESVISSVGATFDITPRLDISELSVLASHPKMDVLFEKCDTNVATYLRDEINTLTVPPELVHGKNLIASMLTNRMDFMSEYRVTLKAAISTNRDCDTINQCYDSLINLNALIPIIQSSKLDIPPRIMDVLLPRLEALKIFTLSLSYALLVFRNNFKGKILVGPYVLNGDELKNMEDADISYEDISKYTMTILENPDSVPQTGIPLSDIISSRERVNELYAKRDEAIKANAAAVLYQARRKALIDTLNIFLAEVDASRMPQNTSQEQFIKSNQSLIDYCAQHLDVYQDNTESLLYDFLIRAFYPNSPVETVHEMMGTEVIRHLNAKEGIDDTDRVAISTVVAARMIARFLFSNVFCVK